MKHNHTRQQAKSGLMSRLKTMTIIGTCAYLLLRMFLIGVEDVSNYNLIRDSIQAAIALYLPYKLGRNLTGTTGGGVFVGYLLLALTGTWLADHEIILWSLLILGYTIDFGPSIYALVATGQHQEEVRECDEPQEELPY